MGFLGELFSAMAREAIKNATIGKAEKSLQETEEKIKLAKKQGKDTSEVEAKLNKYKKKLPEASEQIDDLLNKVI